jgi:hypothetical protein
MNHQKFWREANLRPTKTKSQHYVSQFLLRKFASNGEIHVFDLDKAEEYLRPVTVTAVQNQFYDENVAGTRLSAEDWLAQLESYAAPIIDRLIENPDSVTTLSVEEEFHIARFLVALRFRTPAFRYNDEKRSTKILFQIKDMAKKQIYQLNNKKKANAIWEELEKKPDYWWFKEKEPPQVASVANFMLREVQGFANILRAAPWRIGFAPDYLQLYTSDNPVSGYIPTVRPWWNLAAFGSFSYFIPFSLKVLLVIEGRPNEKGEKKLQPLGDRRHKDFSEWEVSFARHVVTGDSLRYLYGQGPVVSRKCAVRCLEKIERARLEFAIHYLDFDPKPPDGIGPMPEL